MRFVIQRVQRASVTVDNEVIGKIPEWEPVSSHRFEHYGIQRAWKRKSTEDGFIPVPEGMEIPFED